MGLNPMGAFVPNRTLEGQLGHCTQCHQGECFSGGSLGGGACYENTYSGERRFSPVVSLRNEFCLYRKEKDMVLALGGWFGLAEDCIWARPWAQGASTAGAQPQLWPSPLRSLILSPPLQEGAKRTPDLVSGNP